jgi:hypothetical protein
MHKYAFVSHWLWLLLSLLPMEAIKSTTLPLLLILLLLSHILRAFVRDQKMILELFNCFIIVDYTKQQHNDNNSQAECEQKRIHEFRIVRRNETMAGNFFQEFLCPKKTVQQLNYNFHFYCEKKGKERILWRANGINIESKVKELFMIVRLYFLL